MALPKWAEISLFIGAYIGKSINYPAFVKPKCKNRRISLIAGFYCGTSGHCEGKRAAKSWSYNRQSDWLYKWVPHRQEKNNCIIIFAAEFFCVGCPHMMGGDSARQSARHWVIQFLHGAMAITGIVRDRRSRYLIRHGRRATTPNTSDFTQLFLSSPFPHFAQSFATHSAWTSDKIGNKFYRYLPYVRSHHIVHCSPLCLQIMWTFPYERQCVWGIRLPQGKICGHRASLHNDNEWHISEGLTSPFDRLIIRLPYR